MLSEDNIAKINDQIDDELHNADRPFSSHKDRMEALERAVTLKSLLSSQPTRQDILAELASALLKEKSAPAPQSPADLITEIFATFRR